MRDGGSSIWSFIWDGRGSVSSTKLFVLAFYPEVYSLYNLIVLIGGLGHQMRGLDHEVECIKTN